MAHPDSWNTGFELRTMNWRKHVEAYRWVYQRLWERLSRQAVAILDPYAIVLREWISAPQDAEQSQQASFDDEYSFAKEIPMKFQPNIPCLSWPGTDSGPRHAG